MLADSHVPGSVGEPSLVSCPPIFFSAAPEPALFAKRPRQPFPEPGAGIVPA